MYIEQIEKLLLKYFKGEASLEETDFLEDWISKNQQEYIQAVKVYFLTTESKHDIDTDLAYQKFINKINESKTIIIPKRKLVHKILKYAAVIIGISTGTFLFYNNFQKQNSTPFGIKPTNYNKATLVLADGTEIVLEEHQNEEIKSETGVKIINKTKVIKYSSSVHTSKSDSEEVSYNTLYVPNGEIYQIELPDGSNVWLNSATSLKFPTKFIGKERIVSINGEAYFEIRKNSGQKFIVKTATADVTVLGTHFNVSSYKEDNFFTTTLIEGSVQLSTSDSAISKVILKPGQKGSLIKENNSQIDVKEIDVYQDIAWKDGKFFFEKEKLGTITTKLSRWYNADFKFEDQSVANYTFTGVAKKNQNVEYLMDIISMSSKVKYEIIQNTKNNRKLIKINKR